MDEGGEEEQLSFEELGLDPRLIRALAKKKIEKPTLIQQAAIPYILEGKDVVARAHTGSGKTFVYLLPMFHKLFAENGLKKLGPSVFILAPSRELCQQVYSEALSLLEHCRVQLKVMKLTKEMAVSDLTAALASQPEIVVSTPACILSCISSGALKVEAIQESLSMLVLDEADFIFDYQQGNDLQALVPHIPRRCQCLLMSATSSDDIEQWRKLLLHNPVTITLADEHKANDDIIPKTIQQFWISCSAHDKLLHILALLKLDLVQKKVLIFVNSIDMGYKLKLFLEQFGLRSAVLNAELPQNSRLHILEEFNAGIFDYLIATDNSQTKAEEQNMKKDHAQSKKFKKQLKHKADTEFGVVRGIDFKNVYTVINFEMPQSSSGYVHRIGRTGRANCAGSSVSLVSPGESEVFDAVKLMLGLENQESSKSFAPFPFLTKGAVESLRYRAEDVAKGVTKVAIREARAQDLRTEILNSDKLRAHFDSNPRDLDILKHDKVLSKKPPPPHLREVPDYLQDSVAKEASKIIKLSRAAMDVKSSKRRSRSRIRFVKNRDPLKTFSAEGKKLSAGRMKRKGNNREAGSGRRRKRQNRNSERSGM
uniref:RNA helicase n=1 Tax=Anthurium amnicola TaxID=1678845 RepID=A0A1D1Z4A6_9ARAE